nr:hypothetical protein GCM10020185_48360 [Pseudomonas brassicacearum subsp. brassicacearum]
MRAIFKPQALAVAVALGCCAQAQAVSFNIGEIEGQFDSSLSVGASWGMRDADKDLVGTVNGGRGQSSTGDDGRLNFKKGETFSKNLQRPARPRTQVRRYRRVRARQVLV